jgi:hypothetical protein
MPYSIKLFLVGIIISVIIPIIEEISLDGSVDPSKIASGLFSYVPHFWKLGYSALLVFILPTLIIPKFQKQVVEKHYKVYSFLAGNTFGFALIEVITFSLPVQTFQS